MYFNKVYLLSGIHITSLVSLGLDDSVESPGIFKLIMNNRK